MADQQGGKLVYEVDIETAGLIDGSKKAKAEIASLSDEVGKTAPSFDKMSKSAKSVSTALAMPEVNKLSTQLAQLSGKIGTNSEAAIEASVAQNKFSGALSTAAGKLGAGYVSNVGSATASLLKHAQGAIAATNAQMENAISAQKEAIALQGSASQLVLNAAAEKKLAEAAAQTAQTELAAAEAVFTRKQTDIESLEALLSRQKESLKQSEANLQITNSEKAVADAVRARSAVEATQSKILKQSNAAVKEVTDAEDKVKKTKEASVLASQKVTQAVALEAVAVTTAAKANEAAAIATQNLTVAAKAQAVAVTGARSALALLGGPSGVLLLAAAGVYALYQAMNNKTDIEQYKKDIDDAANRVRNLTQAQAEAAGSKTQIKLDADTKSLKDAKDNLSELESALALFQKGGASAAVFGDPTQKAKEFGDKINIAKESVQNLEGEVSKGTAFLSLFSQQAKNAGDATKDQSTANEIFEKSTKSAAEANEFLANSLEKGLAAAQEMAAEKELRNTLAANGVSAQEAEVQVAKLKETLAKKTELTFEQELKSIQDNVKALKIEMTEGKAAAIVYRAAVAAANAGLDPKQTKEYVDAKKEEYQVTKSLADQKKKDASSASSAKKDANAAETVAQKLANLKQQSELAADSTRELSREQQILNAAQSLGASATDEQRKKAMEYKAAALDAADAAKGVAESIKLIPEAGENKSYSESMKSLDTALKAGLIQKDQYNKASEKLEQEHQINLAKIRSDAVVSPQQEAAGLVDPVQALANENAKKLKLIQQFEDNKTITEQQAIALRNDANTQYEKQRMEAQWEIFRNQSQANEMLASSLDALQGGASSAITGLLNGTQSLQEAFANIGTTILNSVVSSFVQMGIEWVKAQVMGQAAATAALAATIGQATAAASAWAPAAISASIATFGSAAAVGQTAYAGSLLAAKGMAVAGARYNGGPVSANSMYRVGEKGKPEIYQASNGSQYMIPGDNGRVISNKDMQGSGGGGGITVQQENHYHFDGKPDDPATLKQFEKVAYNTALRAMRDEQRPNGMLQRTR